VRIAIEVGNGNVLRAEGYGDVIPENAQGIVIEGVFYVPEFKHNLISVSVLTDKKFQVTFQKYDARIERNGVSIRAPKCSSGLWRLMSNALEAPAEPVSAKPRHAPALSAKVPDSEMVDLWHRRFAHLSLGNLKRLVLEGMVKGIELSAAQLREAEAAGQSCEACIMGKSHRAPFPGSESVTTRPLELLHLDVCGPLDVTSTKGHRYFVTLTDDYSSIALVQPLTYKSEAEGFVKRAVALMETQSGRRVAKIRTDRGGEFVNQRLKAFCDGRGIVHQLTAPYTPQQNGKAERLNRTLLEKVRAMLAESGVPKKYWHEALCTASYVRNRSPVAGKDKTPYEQFFGSVPDVSHLRVFGCIAYPHVPAGQRGKLDARAHKGVLLGYEPNSKAYRVLLEDGSIVVSRDVQFAEFVWMFEEVVMDAKGNLKPMEKAEGKPVAEQMLVRNAGGWSRVAATNNAATDSIVRIEAHDLPGLIDDASDSDSEIEDSDEEEVELDPSEPGDDNDDGDDGSNSGSGMSGSGGSPSQGADSGGDRSGAEGGTSSGGSQSGSVGGHASGSDGAATPNGGASEESTGDVATGGENEGATEDDGVPRSRYGRQLKPNPRYAPAFSAFNMAEPKSIEEAKARPDWEQWKEAMDEEMESLLSNRTWDLEELPKVAKKVGLKWVFKLKRDAQGNVERYKARLVAKGFTQQEGVDFGEVFAPVGKYSSLRALLAVVAERDLELHHWWLAGSWTLKRRF
jgi:transposase InsO family protein